MVKKQRTSILISVLLNTLLLLSLSLSLLLQHFLTVFSVQITRHRDLVYIGQSTESFGCVFTPFAEISLSIVFPVSHYPSFMKCAYDRKWVYVHFYAQISIYQSELR